MTAVNACFVVSTGGQTVQLIMEFLPLGSLREYLAKHRLGVAHSLLFAQQICQVRQEHCTVI